MADKKTKSKAGNPQAKVSFGKRREGKHQKAKSPKDAGSKKYIGQGR
jgi:hypothetical protein